MLSYFNKIRILPLIYASFKQGMHYPNPDAKNDILMMKLHLQQSEQQHLITGYDDESISVNQQRYQQNIALSSGQLLLDWCEVGWDKIDGQHFEQLLTLKPALVLLGTGKKHRFIHPKHIQSLTAQHIAVECMSTAAACRTYNILLGEGRQVVAALLLE